MFMDTTDENGESQLQESKQDVCDLLWVNDTQPNKATDVWDHWDDL